MKLTTQSLLRFTSVKAKHNSLTVNLLIPHFEMYMFHLNYFKIISFKNFIMSNYYTKKMKLFVNQSKTSLKKKVGGECLRE